MFENFVHLKLFSLGQNNFTGITPEILGSLDSIGPIIILGVKKGTEIGS